VGAVRAAADEARSNGGEPSGGRILQLGTNNSRASSAAIRKVERRRLRKCHTWRSRRGEIETGRGGGRSGIAEPGALSRRPARKISRPVGTRRPVK
jgi:hypothetical protein